MTGETYNQEILASAAKLALEISDMAIRGVDMIGLCEAAKMSPWTVLNDLNILANRFEVLNLTAKVNGF